MLTITRAVTGRDAGCAYRFFCGLHVINALSSTIARCVLLYGLCPKPIGVYVRRKCSDVRGAG
ncbi:uncharacterized protein BDW47DRAFT_97358 [Aspergillus candidus]|uniref:Uncharacterized protein n=1 Tax=Aspergillus candidus TaxID=41067 RepID=A0A2I2FPI8_ASPCN|nr:hypothetical protein BDW47DRAFT_97358 [Aspergillus candidus]PLB42535.1 hypothetical protein BDW47DRAFT_97358 [Aspergillus candidus]